LAESELCNTPGEIELLPISLNSFALKGIPGQKLEFSFNENDKVTKGNWFLSDEQIIAEVLPNSGLYEKKH